MYIRQYPSTFILLFLLFPTYLFSQHQEFRSLFKEVNPNQLHIYSFSRVPGNFPAGSTYLFKGERIPSRYFGLLSEILGEEATYFERYYACNSFPITAEKDFLLLRAYMEGGGEHHIFGLVFDRAVGMVSQSLKLSYAYGYESGWGKMESWIRDINGDEILEVFSRMQNESMMLRADTLQHTVHDSITISLFDGEKFNTIGLSDPLLRVKLERELPYYEETDFHPDIQTQVLDYLETYASQGFVKKEGYTRWGILIPQGTTFDIAKRKNLDLQRHIEQGFPEDPTYYPVQLYENKGSFWSLIGYFNTQNTTEIALVKLEEKMSMNGKTVILDDWCKDPSFIDGYTKCKN